MAANAVDAKIERWWSGTSFAGVRWARSRPPWLRCSACGWTSFRLERSYWALVTAIVMMGSESAVSLAACRDRLIGTAIGAVVGWATVLIWHGHSLLYGLAVMLCRWRVAH